MTQHGIFVTGTDTEVGKTFVSCAILAALRQAGQPAFALKPVAAGAFLQDGRWVNEDALALQAQAGIALDYDTINPVLLREPIAPHLAAAGEGRAVTVDALATHCERVLAQTPGWALVEGAGGWRVPVNDHECLSDLAVRLQLPVVLVVPIRLGCLNHALLTAEAIRRDGLVLAGWVANLLRKDYAPTAALIDTLQARLGAPCLGQIPQQNAQNGVDFDAVAQHLDLAGLRSAFVDC